jgi:hypothetical protein
MTNLVYLDTETTLDIPAERILSSALGADLETVLILAVGKDGEHYEAGTTGNKATLIWLMERFKHKLLDGSYSR